MRPEMPDWRFTGDRRTRKGFLFNDVFGGPPEYALASESYSNNGSKQYSTSDFDYDSVFKPSALANEQIMNNGSRSTPSLLPVYDVFDGLQGSKSKSTAATSLRSEYNVFASNSSPPSSKSKSMSMDNEFDVLLGNFQRNVKLSETINESGIVSSCSDPLGFDDLLAGFGSSSPSAGNRSMPESSRVSVSIGSSKSGDIPFDVLESSSVPGSSLSRIFMHLLDDRSKLAKSRSARPDPSGNGGVFDDLDLLNGFGKGVQPSSPPMENGWKNDGPSRSMTTQSATSREHEENNFSSYSENNIEGKIPVDNFQGPTSFHVPSVTAHSAKYVGQTASPLYNETSSQLDMSTKSGRAQQLDDVWLTVSDIPLRTQATTAPPPSRTPPLIPHQPSRSKTGVISSSSGKKAGELFFQFF